MIRFVFDSRRPQSVLSTRETSPSKSKIRSGGKRARVVEAVEHRRRCVHGIMLVACIEENFVCRVRLVEDCIVEAKYKDRMTTIFVMRRFFLCAYAGQVGFISRDLPRTSCYVMSKTLSLPQRLPKLPWQGIIYSDFYFVPFLSSFTICSVV